MKSLFPGEPIYTMAFAAFALLLAIAAMTRVDQSAPARAEAGQG
ncbi:hypothetical protein [Sphingopyxis sp.]